MQLKFLVICAMIVAAVAQRGHYAGGNRPINGARYQNGLQANFANQGGQGFPIDNRLTGGDSFSPYQQQPIGFGSGFGFPNPGGGGFNGFPFGFGR